MRVQGSREGGKEGGNKEKIVGKGAREEEGGRRKDGRRKRGRCSKNNEKSH